ncbi:hypothetical protein ACE6H2_012438 [Prunus campanulata]
MVMQAKAWLAEYQQMRYDLVSNIPRSAPKRWVAPRDDFVKINVGGAWKAKDRNGGLGVVVRDEWGTSLQLVCGQLGRLGVLSKSRRWLS